MRTGERQAIARKLASPEYRRALKSADIGNSVLFQLGAMMRGRGWNQRELAKRSGVARSAISKYVRGCEAPSVEVLDKLADAFDVSLGVRFEPYSQLVEHYVGLSWERLCVPGYDEDAKLREMQSVHLGTLQIGSTGELPPDWAVKNSEPPTMPCACGCGEAVKLKPAYFNFTCRSRAWRKRR